MPEMCLYECLTGYNGVDVRYPKGVLLSFAVLIRTVLQVCECAQTKASIHMFFFLYFACVCWFEPVCTVCTK